MSIKNNRSIRIGYFYKYDFLKNAFFLQSSDRLSRDGHSDFFTIDDKSLFLKIRLEDTVGSAQRKANVVTVLLAFASEFTS